MWLTLLQYLLYCGCLEPVPQSLRYACNEVQTEVSVHAFLGNEFLLWNHKPWKIGVIYEMDVNT